MATQVLFGRQLKHWRQVQGLSQLSLATLAKTTTRHLSFLENGKSRPSDQMVMRLAEALEVPVRERNRLLESAGFVGTYPSQELNAAASAPYMDAVRYMINSHAPYPAFVKNRYHEIIEANEPAKRIFLMIEPAGIRGSMIEWALAPRSRAKEVFINYEMVAWSMIYRVQGEAAAAPHDARLQKMAAFAEERSKSLDARHRAEGELVACPGLRLDGQKLHMVGFVARFGSANEANLSELCVELMHPKDDASRKFFSNLAERAPLRLAR